MLMTRADGRPAAGVPSTRWAGQSIADLRGVMAEGVPVLGGVHSTLLDDFGLSPATAKLGLHEAALVKSCRAGAASGAGAVSCPAGRSRR